MAKNPTYPTLYDEVLQISISKLKEWGYLNPDQIRKGTITWSKNGTETASISIMINTNKGQSYIVMDYKYKDEPRNYKIYLTSIPSNLGKGEIWYFLCPNTHKRCRKLYLVDGYFLHREAFAGCMYECQTQSKKSRLFIKSYGTYFKVDEIMELMEKPYFKTMYAGRETKRVKRFMKVIQETRQFSKTELKRMLF